jgi:hypothetical protein
VALVALIGAPIILYHILPLAGVPVALASAVVVVVAVKHLDSWPCCSLPSTRCGASDAGTDASSTPATRSIGRQRSTECTIAQSADMHQRISGSAGKCQCGDR